jgi:hypothetical protein
MVNRIIVYAAILAAIWSSTGCRSTHYCHTAQKPKTKVEFEVSYTHSERSKWQDDSATVKTKWGREF